MPTSVGPRPLKSERVPSVATIRRRHASVFPGRASALVAGVVTGPADVANTGA